MFKSMFINLMMMSSVYIEFIQTSYASENEKGVSKYISKSTGSSKLKKNVSFIPKIKIIVQNNPTLSNPYSEVIAFEHRNSTDVLIQMDEPKKIQFGVVGKLAKNGISVSMNYPNGKEIYSGFGYGVGDGCGVNNDEIPVCYFILGVRDKEDLLDGTYTFSIEYQNGIRKIHKINIITNYYESDFSFYNF